MRKLLSITAVLLLPGVLFAAAPSADPAWGSRLALPDSIREVSDGGQPGGPHVVGSTLTSAQLASTMHVAVSLQMRHALEFHTRLSAGTRIPRDEVEANYLPLRTDYQRVVSWLLSEGFVMDETLDPLRLNIFVHSSVAEVSRVFQAGFARVATSEGEFLSAITAPSVPGAYAPGDPGNHGPAAPPALPPQRAGEALQHPVPRAS